MQKRVQRREVDIKVNVAGSPISAKVGGQKQSPSPAKPANSTFYNLPDPGALAAKYGIPDPDAANSNNINSSNSAANDQSATIAEYEAIISTMRSKVEEKNRKIEQLCVMMEALEPVPGVDPARVQAILNDRLAEDEIDLRDGKIVALAKKSHRLTMQLNKEKATNDRLSQDIVELKRKNDTLLQEIDMLKAAEASRGAETKTYNRHALAHAAKKEEEDQKQESAVNVQRQLRESAKLIDELKAKVKDLSEENKGLSRALQRELGDGVALEQAVDGGWRGRAQQIIMLKSKVKQLEQQLQQGGGGGAGPSSSHGTRRQSSSGYGGQGQGQGQAQDVDSKAVEEIQEMSRERRQIVEALTEERVRLMEQNQALEKRNQGTKARVTILENEIKKLKENLTMVLDKSGTDDQLVDALRAEIQRLQGKLRAADEQALRRTRDRSELSGSLSARNASSASHGHHHRPHSGEDEWREQEQQLQSEIQRLQRLCRNQSEQLDSQDITIRQLRKKMEAPY
eukprot:gene11763-8380_t